MKEIVVETDDGDRVLMTVDGQPTNPDLMKQKV
jgi:hypothetical protein